MKITGRFNINSGTSFILASVLKDTPGHRSLIKCAEKSGAAEILFSKDYSPESVNEEIEKASCEWFAIIAPGVCIKENFTGILKSAAINSQNAGIFYGDFEKNGKRIGLYDYNGDWTERWNFGKLRIYRTDFVKDEGLFSAEFPEAYNYDMLLKFWNKREILRIPEIMYSFDLPEKANALKERLFFPSEGEYGGFSYLFYKEDYKFQVEKCFENFQKRQKIYFFCDNTNKISESISSDGGVVASVVIPVHNRAELLLQAVESVRRQDFEKWEILIVDNCSSDGTYEEALKLSEIEPRIRVFRREDNRIAKALNLGVRNAVGKYIAQLDSDDLYSASTLRKMTDALESDPSAGLAVSYYDLIDQNGVTLEDLGIVRHEEYSVNNILRVDGAGAARVWRKSVIEEMGYFDEKDFCDYGEDYDMVLKVTEKYSLKRVHEVLYHYRRHPGNSDVLRDELFKLTAKNKARLNAWARRKKISGGTEDEIFIY